MPFVCTYIEQKSKISVCSYEISGQIYITYILIASYRTCGSCSTYEVEGHAHTVELVGFTEDADIMLGLR